MSIFEVMKCEGSEEEKVKGIKKLLEGDPEAISLRDKKKGASPLHWAVHLRLPMVAKLLLAKSANINATSNGEETPLHIAAMYDKSAEIIPWLIENGADIEARTNQGATPLLMAAQQGANVAVRFLLDRGADIEARDNEGNTPLHLAADNGHQETVTILLEHGADIEARKQKNLFTPLAGAAWFGHTECIKVLLDRGADIEARDNGGNTPLGVAAFQDQLETVQLLIERGANINVRNAGLASGEDGLSGLRIIDLAQNSKQGSRVAEFLSNHKG